MGKTRKKNKGGGAKKTTASVNQKDNKLVGDVQSFWNDLTGKKPTKGGKANKQQQSQNGVPPVGKDKGNASSLSNRKRQRTSQQERPMVTPDVELTTGVGLPTSLPTVPADTMKGNFCKGDDKWYEILDELTPKLEKEEEQEDGEDAIVIKKVSKFMIDKLRAEAMAYYEQEMEAYEEKQRKLEETDVDLRWTKKVLSSGTLSDKVAAMALMVADDPFHQLKTLDHLLAMARKKGRREAGMAVEALKDLFLNTMLPDRRLMRFNQRVQNSSKVPPKTLVLWHFEDEVKCRYMDFVRAVEAASFDNLEYFKRSMIKTLYELLLEKPELEQLLLTSIVNKVGDPERKIASQVVYLLHQLVRQHPNMRPVVSKEMEQFLHRPNLADRAVYYGVIFLNQIVLRADDDETFAQYLITVYLRLFKDLCLTRDLNRSEEDSKKKKKDKKKAPVAAGTMESKLLSALLTGVNRAFPYANSQGEEFEEQIDALFKMVHVGTFATSTQALMLLLQVMNARKAVSDRFYKALYAKLLSPELHESSKQTLFLNVLYKSIKSDVIQHRQRAFLKRLLQVAANAPAPLAAGCLFMLSEVIQQAPGLAKMIHQAPRRVAKSAERSVVSKLQGAKEALDEDLSSDEEEEPKTNGDDDLSSDEEEPEVAESGQGSPGEEEEKSSDVELVLDEYEPAARDPLFAKATESTLAWELSVLTKHYHPSVQSFANELLTNPLCKIEYKGDPLRDFSTTAFLDRFMYRNPKKNVEESLKKVSVFGREGRSARVGRHALTASAVNSAKFATMDESKVRDNEKFFYRFFQDKIQREGIDSLAKASKAKNPDVFESDEEEEQFAQSLAEKLMRDHGDGKGADDHDDIDIDFNYSSDEDDNTKSSAQKKEGSNEEDEGEDDSEEEWPSDGEVEGNAEKMLFGDNDDSSDEEVPDFDEDMDDEDEEDDSEDDDMEYTNLSAEMRKKIKKIRSGKSKSSSAFAAAEEFAEVLETAGDDGVHAKQAAWEERGEVQLSQGSGKRKRKTAPKKSKKSRRR